VVLLTLRASLAHHRTCVGIDMIVLLNEDGVNIHSAIGLDMLPAEALIEVKMSCHVHRGENCHGVRLLSVHQPRGGA
jgi:hypothetical protein